jgi:hypothetical protein
MQCKNYVDALNCSSVKLVTKLTQILDTSHRPVQVETQNTSAAGV